MLFAPPKTGFSTLINTFPETHRGVNLPRDKPIYGSVRDPVDRWLSAYNMMVLWGYKRDNQDQDDMREDLGAAWFDRWFPDPDSITDPVGFCRAWLLEAQPVVEQYAGDLHLTSQTRVYQRLLGDQWQSDPRLHLFPMQQWIGIMWKQTGTVVNSISNQGQYRVPRHYFNTVLPLIRQTFARDVELWNSVRLNTL